MSVHICSTMLVGVFLKNTISSFLNQNFFGKLLLKGKQQLMDFFGQQHVQAAVAEINVFAEF